MALLDSLSGGPVGAPPLVLSLQLLRYIHYLSYILSLLTQIHAHKHIIVHTDNTQCVVYTDELSSYSPPVIPYRRSAPSLGPCCLRYSHRWWCSLVQLGTRPPLVISKCWQTVLIQCYNIWRNTCVTNMSNCVFQAHCCLCLYLCLYLFVDLLRLNVCMCVCVCATL